MLDGSWWIILSPSTPRAMNSLLFTLSSLPSSHHSLPLCLSMAPVLSQSLVSSLPIPVYPPLCSFEQGSLAVSLLSTPWIPTALMLRPRSSSQVLSPFLAWSLLTSPAIIYSSRVSHIMTPSDHSDQWGLIRPHLVVPVQALCPLVCPWSIFPPCPFVEGKGLFGLGPAGPSLRLAPRLQPDSLCQNL